MPKHSWSVQWVRFAIAAGSLTGVLVADASPAESMSGRPAPVLETVQVYAQKRKQDIQDVPLAITAVSGEALREQNIVHLQQLRNIDTSVQFRIQTAPTNSAFSIRGIGTSSFSAGIEQSVSVVLDGVVLGDPSTVATLSDIEHVEIAKGPQGLLFGKNASSGVISIHTNDAKLDQRETQVHLSIGDNGERIYQAVVNLSLEERLAVRLAGSHNHLDGFVRSPVSGRRFMEVDNNGVAAKLHWKPSDELSVRLSADYSYTDKFCCLQTIRSAPDPHTIVAIANEQAGIDAGPENFEVASNAPATGYGRVRGAALRVNYDLGGYDLESITGYRRTRRSNFYDVDFSPLNFADYNGLYNDIENYSEELRLLSPQSERFDFVAGLFFYRLNNTAQIAQRGNFYNLPSNTAGTYTPPAAPGVNQDMLSPTGASTLKTVGVQTTAHSNSYAAYAQGNYHFNDTLTLSLGGRVTRDEIRAVFIAGPFGDPSLALRSGNIYAGYAGPYVTPCVRPPAANANCFDAIDKRTSATNFSWRVTLQNEFTPEIMGYATVARGYKGPGFSYITVPASAFTPGTGAPPDQRIGPEIPLTYEVGMKTELFDRRLVLNADVFKTRYTGFQAQVATSTPNGFVAQIFNAGSVTTEGAELTLGVTPMEGFDLSLGATYLDARYGNFPGVSCYNNYAPTSANSNRTLAQPGCGVAPNAPGTINVDGNRVALAPQWQYKVGAGYERAALIRDLSGYLRATWTEQAQFNFSANGDPGTVSPRFGLLSGEIGIMTADERFQLALYGTNLLDEHWAASINASPTQGLNPGGYIQYFGPDSFRHVGVRFDARF